MQLVSSFSPYSYGIKNTCSTHEESSHWRFGALSACAESGDPYGEGIGRRACPAGDEDLTYIEDVPSSGFRGSDGLWSSDELAPSGSGFTGT